MDSLLLRRSIACALEEQNGPGHPHTLDAVEGLANALERWAAALSEDESADSGTADVERHQSRATEALRQVAALRGAAAAERAAAAAAAHPRRDLFVPPHEIGQPTGKGRPPEPKDPEVFDFQGRGGLGIFSR